LTNDATPTNIKAMTNQEIANQPQPISLNTNQSPSSEPVKKQSFPFIWILFLLAIVMIIIAGILIYLMYFTTTLTKQTISIPQVFVTPSPPTTDTAPGMPISQKEHVLVHHSDSTFEIFLVPTSTIDTFMKTLPKGDTVVSTTK
jgi:flagellar basal body-associated protein FliL